METLNEVLDYHERTKHRPSRYAASLGYMDWSTQPNPFRYYSGCDRIVLTHDTLSVPYSALFSPQTLAKAPLCLESISHLLRYSLGLAAWKHYGPSRWALRCNASSGNLHPSECYLITPSFGSGEFPAALMHYAPREHILEVLHPLETTDTMDGSEGFYLILNSVLWREAWKYGERSWRYCQLDAGHAYEAIRLSAASLGWHCRILPVDTNTIAHASGADQCQRFHPEEYESPDMILWISSETDRPAFELPKLPVLASQANRLSPSHHSWPILEQIDRATRGLYPPHRPLGRNRKTPPSTAPSSEVILKRRSAQMMDQSGIDEASFRRLLDASLFCDTSGDVHFILFVHRVEGLEKGMYLFIRNPRNETLLRNSLQADFIWKDCGEGLYLLRSGDCRGQAQYISCNQEIARDGAFSFGMLCRFSSVLEEEGAIGYKALYHQCGAIGQTMYLEATSMGLSATGIGCFLDDEMHALLGISSERPFQSLYHFTIGRAVVDTRIATDPPY